MARATVSRTAQREGQKQERGFSSESSPRPVPSGSHAEILALQGTVGNRAVSQLLRATTGSPAMIQTKLTIGQPGDKYEQEADRVAEQVMRMPEPRSPDNGAVKEWVQKPHIQRLCPACEEELQRQPMEEEEEEEKLLQAKTVLGRTPEVTPDLNARIQSLRSGGRPLPESTRAFFEPRFGYDFSEVRIHMDAEAARALKAQAFTLGKNVVFGAGQYVPGTREGQQLLAHELTHIVQQGAANPSRLAKLTNWPSRPSPLDITDNHMLQESLQVSMPILHRQSAPMIQLRVSFNVLDWGAVKEQTPTPQNANNPLQIDLPPDPPQIGVAAFVQVNGDADDPCADFEVGTMQTAWIAWLKMYYQGRNSGDGSIKVRYLPDLPMRDPGPDGDIWYDPNFVRRASSCGDEVSILHRDAPFHLQIPKMLSNSAVPGSPFNYLRSYTRGLHVVTYLTARGPSGFLQEPLRFVYWNSLQDFTFTPIFDNPSEEWAFQGQVRVNIGAKGRGVTEDAPYFTTTGTHINDHIQVDSNWETDERS